MSQKTGGGRGRKPTRGDRIDEKRQQSKSLISISLSVILIDNAGLQKQMVRPLGASRGCSGFRLRRAAAEVIAGQVEADLGSFLFKKRLARQGSGKRSGYRVVTGYKKPNSNRIVFLYAFAKNVRANISDKEREALSLVAEAFVSATEEQVNFLLQEGSIVEVQPHE